MRNLLPFLFILACPVMMIFMMRGMRSGHGTSKPRPEMHTGQPGRVIPPRQYGSATQDLQTPSERIDALEHELAQLRSLQNRHSDQDRSRQP